MGKFSYSCCVTLAACALGAGVAPAFAQSGSSDRNVPPVVAQQQKSEVAKGDPKRWYKAPRTDQARLQIQRKEIAAAYNEARTACQRGAAAQRRACLAQARTAYQSDLSNARGLVAMAPSASVTERVTPVDPAANTTAVGASGAGATGAGAGRDAMGTGGQGGQAGAAAGQQGWQGGSQSGAAASGQQQEGTAGSSGVSQQGSSQAGGAAAGQQGAVTVGQPATSAATNESRPANPPPSEPRPDRRY